MYRVQLPLLFRRDGTHGAVFSHLLVDGSQVGAELHGVVAAAQRVVLEVVYCFAMAAHTAQHRILARQRDGFEFVPSPMECGQVGKRHRSQHDHQQHYAAKAGMQPGLHLHLLEHDPLLADRESL